MSNFICGLSIGFAVGVWVQLGITEYYRRKLGYKFGEPYLRKPKVDS